jgi:endonuclease YncB( thermonuclease family)
MWHDFVAQASHARASHPQTPIAAASVSGNGSGKALASASTPLRGEASVVDTATLDVNGQSIRLFGVEGTNGARALREFDRVLRRGEVECVPAAEQAETYRCSLKGHDLSQLVLFNGGGRATPEASPELLAAEEQARSARVGLWRR